MGRRKQPKFAQNRASRNVIETGKPTFETIKGKWREFFGNDHDLVLELACGRGEYTVGLAEAYPDRNFVGVDIKGDRIWKGSQAAQAKGLDNAAFLRTLIHHLDDFFEPGEASEIWLVHPDPRPKSSDERRRLTHPRFLEIYRRLLAPGGWFRFKTDNPGLFDYTLETLQDWPVEDLVYTRDLYRSDLLEEHRGITTKYERIFVEQGFTVNYLKFRFAETDKQSPA